MKYRDIGTDDPRVKVRPAKASRPRTKTRPNYTQATSALVIGVDRGRYLTYLPDATQVTAVKARSLDRGSVIVGDAVRLVGDTTGKTDTLARIVQVEERTTLLRRSAEDGDHIGHEKAIVANADQMLIVCAAANPTPRFGMVDRCVVAALDTGIKPVLCMTKADLADARDFTRQYLDLDIPVLTTCLTPGGQISGISALRQVLNGHFTVFVGHSGVGKSTIINSLVPEAGRQVAKVNETTGRGRHTSTSSAAWHLAELQAWVVDTPGVRSFGLSHVTTQGIISGFSDLAPIVTQCPRGCSHLDHEPTCALDQTDFALNGERVRSLRRLLHYGNPL